MSSSLPLVSEWTNADSAAAVEEGWNLFNLATVPVIQRDDEAAIFDSDDTAIAFVKASNRHHCVKALALVSKQPLYKSDPGKGNYYHLLTTPVPTEERDQDGRRKFIVGESFGVWSVSTPNGFEAPPPIGTRVSVNFNNLGAGEVVGYFTEGTGRGRYVGVEVKPDQRPQWHIKAHGVAHPHYLVFGAEIRQAMTIQPMPALPQQSPSAAPGGRKR